MLFFLWKVTMMRQRSQALALHRVLAPRSDESWNRQLRYLFNGGNLTLINMFVANFFSFTFSLKPHQTFFRNLKNPSLVRNKVHRVVPTLPPPHRTQLRKSNSMQVVLYLSHPIRGKSNSDCDWLAWFFVSIWIGQNNYFWEPIYCPLQNNASRSE